MTKETQCNKIYDYMTMYGTRSWITPAEAKKFYGCTRLAARIYDLKLRGFNIKSEFVRVRTRNGMTTVKRYRLA